MTAHVRATGFEADGVRLITPADVEFDALIEILAAPGWAQTLREAAPSIVIVANETDQTVTTAPYRQEESFAWRHCAPSALQVS